MFFGFTVRNKELEPEKEVEKLKREFKIKIDWNKAFETAMFRVKMQILSGFIAILIGIPAGIVLISSMADDISFFAKEDQFFRFMFFVFAPAILLTTIVGWFLHMKFLKITIRRVNVR